MAERQIHAWNHVISNSSGNSAKFLMEGGSYGVDVTATFSGGSVTLQKLSADDTTWVTCLTAFTAAGYATANLPQGTYRVAIATASAVYVRITAIVSSGE